MAMTEEPQRLTESRVQEIAERVAERSVQATFRLLGTDLTAIEDVNNLRDDFRFTKRRRVRAEFRSSETSKSIIAAATGAIIGMLISVITWLASSMRHPQ